MFVKATIFRLFVFFLVSPLFIILCNNIACAEEVIKENPSNPLAAVSNLDLIGQYLDLGDDYERYDYSLEGATMLHEKIKLKYELHYWDTDVTGKSENDWEKLIIKPIFFVREGVYRETKYRLAVGFDWAHDFDNADKGVGRGSSTIAPFVGLALKATEKMTLIPLVQHFVSYDGDSVNETSFRLIGIKRLPQQMWVKLDAKLPVDWHNDESVPASAELQWGKMFNARFGTFVDGLVGIGGDRSYDYGFGIGVRTMF